MRLGAALLLLGVVACEVDPADAPRGVALAAPPTATIVGPIAATASAQVAEPPCSAPSLAGAGPLDARDSSALAKCERPSTGHGRAARLCGQGAEPAAIDHERLNRAVRPLDKATRAHVKAIASKGVEQARRANVFGLVGDSMTVSGAFLRHAPRALDPQIDRALRDHAGDSIIDFYAEAQATRLRGQWTDSFGAPRAAAKVGARAPWALEGGGSSPLMTMITQLSPGVAVVLFGGNDAAFTGHMSLSELSDQFAKDLEAIVDALETRGIIPVLNTLARHGSAPGFEDCAAGREFSNWRIAVQTNALSARVVEVACRRNLPLIDVRDALDTAVNQGLAPDQIHPSAYEKGPEILDKRGLQCGYNVRNYVTLLMLKRIRELVFVEDAPGNRSSKQ